MAAALDSITLDEGVFTGLLGKLIGEAKHLQNNYPEFIPKEDRAVRHVLDVLQKHSTDEGGPLQIQHVSYAEGRGNLIITYPGTEPGKVVSFVGCHFDVVTANPDDWEHDPFKLTIDGDKLRGRGTTDCLGHVALVTDVFRQLAVTKPALKTTVVAVFIANEEDASVSGIGVDGLVSHGLLDHLRNGPLFWVDAADKQPCTGTAGMAAWKLKATGKLFHSGLPNKAINPIELAMDALSEMQRRFYEDFPADPREELYKYTTPSTFKPTQWSCPQGSINQIPGECSISGDIRITPFYNMNDVIAKMQSYVQDLNDNIATLGKRGPCSKYTLPAEDLSGKLVLEFEKMRMQGVACDLDSPGFKALCGATEAVLGTVKPYSITGSLPLIRELKDAGFDVQTVGYGVMATYHARNEYCLLSDFKQGFQILMKIISTLEG